MNQVIPLIGTRVSLVRHRKALMTRIIDDRRSGAPGEDMIRLRVWQLDEGDVRACLIPLDMACDQNTTLKISDPVDEAFLDALAACEADEIGTLWIDDPHGLFPPADRPIREIG